MYNLQNVVNSVDEVTSLEYAQLKVHYELLNRKFRACQRSGDEHFHFARKSVEEIEAILARSSNEQPLTLSSASFLDLQAYFMLTCAFRFAILFNS